MSQELIFASENEALQHLANITGKKIKIAYSDPEDMSNEDLIKSWKNLDEDVKSLRDEHERLKDQHEEELDDLKYNTYEQLLDKSKQLNEINKEVDERLTEEEFKDLWAKNT
jgi:hypothetical protein